MTADAAVFTRQEGHGAELIDGAGQGQHRNTFVSSC